MSRAVRLALILALTAVHLAAVPASAAESEKKGFFSWFKKKSQAPKVEKAVPVPAPSADDTAELEERLQSMPPGQREKLATEFLQGLKQDEAYVENQLRTLPPDPKEEALARYRRETEELHERFFASYASLPAGEKEKKLAVFQKKAAAARRQLARKLESMPLDEKDRAARELELRIARRKAQLRDWIRLQKEIFERQYGGVESAREREVKALEAKLADEARKIESGPDAGGERRAEAMRDFTNRMKERDAAFRKEMEALPVGPRELARLDYKKKRDEAVKQFESRLAALPPDPKELLRREIEEKSRKK